MPPNPHLLKLKALILTLFFFALAPIALIFLIPIYTYRYILGKLNLLIRGPNGGKILSTKSAVFAADDIYGRPKCILIVFLLIEGQLPLDSIRRQAYNSMVLKRNEEVTGNLLYPELQQFVSSWFGFKFWRPETNFDIADHVYEYDNTVDLPLNLETIPYFVNDLTSRAFAKDKSPWEVHVFHKSQLETFQAFRDPSDPLVNGVRPRQVPADGQTIIAFRVHHALADGISLRKLLLDVIGYKMPEVGNQPALQLQLSSTSKLWYHLKRTGRIVTLPVLAPFQTIEALLACSDVNDWHNANSPKLTGELRSAATAPLSVDFVKALKSGLGVSFAGVVLAALAGGIREYMLQRGLQVPEAMHCLTPLPMPGHSDKLRNHLTAAAIRLPTGLAGPLERLHSIAEHLRELQTSLVPATNYLFYPFLGGLFPWMTHRLFRHDLTTALMSSFQGPPERIYFLDREIHEMIFTGGLLEGKMGIGFTLLSYDGLFRILMGADKTILSSHAEADLLTRLVYQEFFKFRDHLLP